MILKLSYAVILGTQTTVLFEYRFHDTQTQLCCDVVLILGTQTTVRLKYHFLNKNPFSDANDWENW